MVGKNTEGKQSGSELNKGSYGGQNLSNISISCADKKTLVHTHRERKG